MTQHRIMLLGAAGLVGQAIQHLAAQDGAFPDWKLGLFSRAECDITNPAALRSAMQDFKPDLVINAACLARIDGAEEDHETADAVNFRAVAQMAAQCSALDVPLIHLSTDYVFDGRQNAPYMPDDQMNPVSHYGQSRMMGEEAIRHETPFHVILRVSSVFGPFRRNLLTSTLKAIEEKDELRVVNDIIAGPTSALDVAKAVIVIGTEILAGKTDGFGTFHLCGTPACSRYTFTEAVLKAYAPHTKKHPRLTPIVSNDLPHLKLRPRYSALECSKIKNVYGIEQKTWQDGIDASLAILSNAGRMPR
jgi:dTDP-4-dehydrorhamnose reductase